MNNSFWRKVIDGLPGLFLLFRVDEKENAHIIFANAQIENVLGYSPGDFVLASENEDSKVAREVTNLVEKIAALSHRPDNATPKCRFHTRSGIEYSFSFEFRIFSIKSTPLPFIAVSLTKISDEPPEQLKQEKTDNIPTAKSAESDEKYPFAVESVLMKALMQKVHGIIEKPSHILFIGDASTGKRTLAKKVLKREESKGSYCLKWDLSSFSTTEQDEALQELLSWHEQQGSDQKNPVAILIVEIGSLTSSNQQVFCEWIESRIQLGLQTRVLATTRTLLEERIKKGKFSMDLYYLLSFETLLLPPLSQRKEDIRFLVRDWLARAADAVGLGPLNVPDHVMENMLSYPWPGNFDEFYQTMRNSLLHSGPKAFRLMLPQVSARDDADSGQTLSSRASKEFLTFEEMNRRYLLEVLSKTGGKIYGNDGAAHILNMKPTTLQSKLKKLQIR